MAQERVFVKKSIDRLEIERFLEKEFNRGGYSHSEIQKTPLAVRITVYAHKPGLIIGRGGKNIERITNMLKEKFDFENPQLDVQEILNPNLNATIVAKQIASAIERGINHKRVANMTVRRVMDSGAIGIAIRVGGKVGGNMSRTDKFQEGYLKFAGDTAETLVDEADSTAHVKLGTIGIRVKILTQLPSDRITIKKLMDEDGIKIEIPEEPKIHETKTEEKVEENGDNKEKTVERTEQ